MRFRYQVLGYDVNVNIATSIRSEQQIIVFGLIYEISVSYL